MPVAPFFLFTIARQIAGLGLVVATLPNGDVDRTLFLSVSDGLRAIVEHQIARSDVRQVESHVLPRGRYDWHIDEERRTVLFAAPGRPEGTVRRAFVLSAWVNARPDARDPVPAEVFRIYVGTREDAEALRKRLADALKPTRR